MKELLEYVQSTLVNDLLFPSSNVDGIYRVDGPDSFTVVADIGAFNLTHPPTIQFPYFIATGLQYALQTYGGGFLVSDAHLNRVLRVTLDGEISVLIAFNNIVPTGLEVRGNMVYMTEAGPDPHLPQDGKVVLFGPRSPTPTELASDTPSSLTWNLAVAVSAVTGSTLATPRTPSVPKIFFCSVTALIETLV